MVLAWQTFVNICTDCAINHSSLNLQSFIRTSNLGGSSYVATSDCCKLYFHSGAIWLPKLVRETGFGSQPIFVTAPMNCECFRIWAGIALSNSDHISILLNNNRYIYSQN